MAKSPATFSTLLLSLSTHGSFCPTLETLFFRHSRLEAWFRPLTNDSTTSDPDLAGVKSAFDRLADSHQADTLCLYTTTETEAVRTLKDLRVASDRRLFAERIRIVQVLPPGYEHKRVHCLELKYLNRAYHCSYTVKEDKQVRECTNERWFFKLKDVSMRIIRAIEASTSQRLTQAQFAFLLYEGRFLLHNIPVCVLVPESSFLLEVLATPPLSPRPMLQTAQQSPDTSLSSPLRIRTPACTCPNSPQRKVSCRDQSRKPPISSPVRFFGHNFKEMIAKSVEKGRRLRAVGRARHRVDIDEVVKDDETFFQYVGVSENVEGSPQKARAALSVSTDHCASSASTHTSSPLLIPKHLIRMLKPLKAKLLFPKPPLPPAVTRP